MSASNHRQTSSSDDMSASNANVGRAPVPRRPPACTGAKLGGIAASWSRAKDASENACRFSQSASKEKASPSDHSTETASRSSRMRACRALGAERSAADERLRCPVPASTCGGALNQSQRAEKVDGGVPSAQVTRMVPASPIAAVATREAPVCASTAVENAAVVARERKGRSAARKRARLRATSGGAFEHGKRARTAGITRHDCMEPLMKIKQRLREAARAR